MIKNVRHDCHWPGCEISVPASLWGCKFHWMALPKDLRDKIWLTYRPGQEINGTPSPEYIAVAREVQEWILTNQKPAPKIEKIANT